MRKLAVVLVVLTILSPFAVTPTFADASCPDSLPTQLTVGGRGQIAQSFSTLRDAPAGNPIQVVNAPAQFTVLAGPTSDGFFCYFQIQYDSGATGWALESQITSDFGSQYWLTPVAGQPPPPPLTTTPTPSTSCPGSLATRLTVGGRGSIAASFSTLRDAPGGNPIQVVNAPASFTVLAGPASDGFLCYFQIQYDSGATGWASESQVTSDFGSQYWLAPDSAG